jgi:DNA polymerase-3 subunit epsilon
MEQERNLLAALMAELNEGVVACNLEGQILLYNRNARVLLGSSGDEGGSAYVGLGRSLFSVLEREAIVHAIDQVEARGARFAGGPDERAVVVSFVTTAANGQLLRAHLAPFSGAGGELRGYVLIVQDIGEGIERSMRRDRLLQELTERTRGSVAAIRAAIESIEHFPQMSTEQRARLQAVILDEAQLLSSHLGETLRTHSSDLRAQWRLEEIHGADLLWSIQRRLAATSGIDAQIGELDESLWLKIDSYTLLQGLGLVLHQLGQEFAIGSVEIRLRPDGGFGALDLSWSLGEASLPRWETWKRQALVVDDSDGVLSLREVAERHGGEVWVQLLPAESSAYIRLLLPLAAEPQRLTPPAPASPTEAVSHLESRPEYYDFDLFRARAAGHAAEDGRMLRELVCTVFDTETTGLTPLYDEIISIGAVRVVNGRMLRQEIFEQLVDPRRPIPETAIAVHGITDAIVRGQPTIERVLPRFHQFAHDTILVGHNLSFDLRMFEVKEAQAGVRFDQPVLDTLLLSTVVHPDEQSHSLEAIAKRLGLKPLGRHTALGDALLTGEIFLHLLPLLSAQGITTLRAATEASQASYLARITYS